MTISNQNFDEIMKKNLENMFPLQVKTDNGFGSLLFDERHPQLNGLHVKFNSCSYDDVSNHLSFGYDVLSNPNNIETNSIDFKQIMFRIAQTIYELECMLVLQEQNSKKDYE